MRGRSCWLAVAVLTGSAAAAHGVQKIPQAAYQSAVPQAAVPLMRRPPILDGMLGDDEWRGAAGITGFSRVQCGFGAVPPPMQARAFLGYDAANLYVGFRVSRPPNLRVPPAQHDAGGTIESGDHLWLIFLLGSTNLHFKVNPHGVFSDQRVTPADQGRDRHTVGIAWESGAAVTGGVHEATWDVEMAIPFAAFGLAGAPPDDTAWRAVLSYGRNYSGHDKMEWNGTPNWTTGGAGYLYFGRRVPAVEIAGFGDLSLPAPEFRPVVRLSNATEATQDVSVAVSAECGAETLAQVREDVRLAPGEAREVAPPARRLALPEGWTGRVVVDVNTPADHLFSQMTQFQPLQVKSYRQYARFWPFDSSLGGVWDLGCAHYPYFESMDVWADVTWPALPVEAREAARCRVDLFRDRGGAALRSDVLALTNGQRRAHWAGLKLGEGGYALVGTLEGADGRPVGPTLTNRFVRQVFPWEHNTLGVTDRVFPPFTALRVSKDRSAVFAWGRRYDVGACGLPGAIAATPEAECGEQRIAGPMRLEVVAHGVRRVLQVPTRIAKAQEGIVRFRSEGADAGLALRAESFLQYDGWYEVHLTVTPEAPLALDALELVVPFGPYPDTYYGYRGSWFYGELPRRDGELWNNVAKSDNLFTPALAVGNGDVALWWYGDSDEGWRLSYSNASQRLTRDADGVNLRVSLVNAPRVLDGPVTATFALLASPVRPMTPGFRAHQWGVLPKFHDTAGYAYWGNGIDSITPGSDEGYRRTREAIDRWTERTATNAPKPFPLIILYNSGMLLGQGMEEFDTFGGEWVGRTPPEPTPEFPDSDLHAQVPWHGGLRQDWRGQPKRLGPTVADLTQSCVDCRIWHYRQNLEKLGINGYWFDNQPIWAGSNPSTGRAYVTDEGKVRPKYCLFNRHQLFRRLFALCGEARTESCNYTSYGPDFSFAGGLWLTEMDAYVYRHGGDLFETLEQRRHYDIVSNVLDVEAEQLDPLSRFRGMTRMRRNIPAFLRSNVTDEHASRGVLGLCLLHDVGCAGGVNGGLHASLVGVLRAFGLFDGDILFVPYWRNSEWVGGAPEGTLASVYLNRGTSRALAVLVNPLRERRAGTLALRRPPGAPAGSGLSDPEASAPLKAVAGDGLIRTELDVPPREYRLVLWE